MSRPLHFARLFQTRPMHSPAAAIKNSTLVAGSGAGLSTGSTSMLNANRLSPNPRDGALIGVFSCGAAAPLK
jgi:hypothetical protein